MIFEKIRQQAEESHYKISYKYKKRIIKLNDEMQEANKKYSKFDVPVLNMYDYSNQISAFEDGDIEEFDGTVSEALCKVSDISYGSRRRLKKGEISAAIMLKKKKAEASKVRAELHEKMSKVENLMRYFGKKNGKITHVKDMKNLDLLLSLTGREYSIRPEVVLDELSRRGIPPID